MQTWPQFSGASAARRNRAYCNYCDKTECDVKQRKGFIFESNS